jgi:PKD repeat protein
MDTPDNNINPTIPEELPPPSLLDQIIQTSKQSDMTIDHEWTDSSQKETTQDTSWEIIPPPIIKKPRDPLTAGMVLKMIGSLLIVAVIFFGSFLAYIAFNPDQAAFFVNIFGINPNDIKDLLKKLINGSFGIIVLLFSIIWITSLFKAVWTPREQKRRRLMSWLTAGLVGIILFSILAFWAFLFKTIDATPYDNLSGEITIYDNDIYVHPAFRQYARVQSTTNLVGPITLKYDLSTNVKAISKKNLITIESYEINFDGATCANGKSIMDGSNPLTEQWLICTFDQVRTYNIRGTYKWKDRLGEISTITMPLNTVEIKGIIEINTTINKDKKKVITLNAAKVKNLWNPRWTYPDRANIEKVQTSITEEISNTPLLICLSLFDNSCDRIFILSDTDISESSIEGTIQFNQDSTNSLGVIMTLTGVNISNNEIVNIDWVDNAGNRLCKWTSEKCEYVFSSYGTKNIIATITLANKKTYTIQWNIILNKPLLIIQHAKILDQDNNLLNPSETFDTSLGAYLIKNIVVPTKITLDARDIILENSGYKMRNVTWKISHDGITEEKIWEKVIFELPQTVRYTIDAIYTFEKNSKTNDDDSFVAKDTIIIDLEHKSLEPIINIQQSSDYAPSKITFDASSSQSKNGTIQKFIFDFGEGRPQAEGDAIQIYEYRTAWEKKITLTIVDNNNEQASISKFIVLKDTPKNILFSTSMAPIMNIPVDFTADGTTGEIEEWIWNFWDNTAVSKWYEVTHTYNKAGTYTVTMTVRYVDGTEKSINKIFQVGATLE